MVIFVAGLDMQAMVGVHAHEHGRTQTLLYDLEVVIPDPAQDILTDTLDYEWIVAEIERLTGSRHIQLVEIIARQVGEAILLHPAAKRVTVRVTKPSALSKASAAGAIWNGEKA